MKYIAGDVVWMMQTEMHRVQRMHWGLHSAVRSSALQLCRVTVRNKRDVTRSMQLLLPQFSVSIPQCFHSEMKQESLAYTGMYQCPIERRSDSPYCEKC